MAVGVRLGLVVLLLAGCERKSATAPERDPAAVVVAPAPDAAPAVARAPDAAPAPRGPLLGQVAIARGAGVTLHELRADGITAGSTTTVPEAPRALVWPSPAGPVFLTAGDAVGAVHEGVYGAIDGRGEGDAFDLHVDADGAVWLERCLSWEPVGDLDGCSKLRTFEVAPGERQRATPPPARPLPAGLAPPRGFALITGTASDGTATFHTLDCDDGTGRRALFEVGAQVTSTPTWRWLAASPPLALLWLDMAPQSEPEPSIFLLRGCDATEARITLGPDGLWAVRNDDDTWTIHHRDAELGRVEGDAVAFAGGHDPRLSR